MEEYWPLVNEIEEAWTGVEERDRAIISRLVPQDNTMFLIMVCLWFNTPYRKLKDVVGILRGPSRASIVR